MNVFQIYQVSFKGVNLKKGREDVDLFSTLKSHQYLFGRGGLPTNTWTDREGAVSGKSCEPSFCFPES